MAALTVRLTRPELCALVDFLSAILNDPDTLGTTGLSEDEKSAVHSAYDALLARTAH